MIKLSFLGSQLFRYLHLDNKVEQTTPLTAKFRQPFVMEAKDSPGLRTRRDRHGDRAVQRRNLQRCPQDGVENRDGRRLPEIGATALKARVRRTVNDDVEVA